MEEFKICNECGEEKVNTREFWYMNRGKLLNRCKVCCSNYQKKPEVMEKLNASRRFKYATDSEFKEKRKLQDKKYNSSGNRKKNLDIPEKRAKHNANKRAYYVRNREQELAKNKQYRKDNPMYFKNYTENRTKRLPDADVIKKIIRFKPSLVKEDIPQQLIESRRLCLLLKRTHPNWPKTQKKYDHEWKT